MARASQIEALRRVDRFDDFLARMNNIGEGQDLADVSVRYRHADLTDPCPKINLCASPMETSTVSPSELISDDDSSYIGCVSIRFSPRRQEYVTERRNGPVVTQKVSTPRKKRNNRFQNFVAAKHNQRAKTLSDHSRAKVPTNQPGSTSDELGISIPALEIQHCEAEELNVSPSGGFLAQCNSKELPISVADASPSERHLVQCNSDESPTYLVKLPSVRLPLCGSDNDKSPGLGEQVVKKQVFNSIRVESNSNPKGIIQHNCRTYGEVRQTKNLTWWDDDKNKDKPSTLKTDEFSWDDELKTYESSWDDDSTWDHVDEKDSCNSKCNCDFFAVQRKRVEWVEEEEKSPFEAPELDLLSLDEAIDSEDDENNSIYHHIPFDTGIRRIIGDFLGYYRGKLEDSFSLSAKSSSEDEDILGDCSNSTPQEVCNTSCLAA